MGILSKDTPSQTLLASLFSLSTYNCHSLAFWFLSHIYSEKNPSFLSPSSTLKHTWSKRELLTDYPQSAGTKPAHGRGLSGAGHHNLRGRRSWGDFPSSRPLSTTPGAFGQVLLRVLLDKSMSLNCKLSGFTWPSPAVPKS